MSLVFGNNGAAESYRVGTQQLLPFYFNHRLSRIITQISTDSNSL